MAICGILGKYSKTERTLFEISKLRVLRPKLYLNIEVYLRRGDICYVEMLSAFEQSVPLVNHAAWLGNSPTSYRI